METFVVLLRGVMPVGKNKVPMAQLREVLSKEGFTAVRTYIQSGNAVLQSTLTASEIEERVHKAIKKHIGPDLAIVVKKGEQLQEVLDNNPFTDLDISRIFFTLFAKIPDEQKVMELQKQDFSPEKVFFYKKSSLYVHSRISRQVGIEQQLS